MLRSLKSIERYGVSATDGEVGSVVTFLFDDERWVVRYLVVETGGFLDRHRVLISPAFFRQADWMSQRFELALTVDKIRKSPDIDVDRSVSRQHEQDYYGYYGYPYYWGYAGLWGTSSSPALMTLNSVRPTPAPHPERSPGDAHLRSVNELIGYGIEGSDGGIGHVADLIVDDESWEIRYLVIDTRHWWHAKKVLAAPQWTSQISWEGKTVHMNLSRQAVKEGPAWDASAPINRKYETHLYDYYGRPAYWQGGEGPERVMPSPDAGHQG